MSSNKISAILNHEVTEHILLLQGPVGYFFSELHDHLLEYGAKKILKVNYNYGDDFFYRQDDVIRFNQPFHKLLEFYRRLFKDYGITSVYLFGDCRYIHQTAIAVAKELHIPAYVFEEGYIRPNYITLEQGGVNGHSPICFQTMGQIPDLPLKDTSVNHKKKSDQIGYGSFRRMVMFGFIYFCLCRIFKRKYPFYIHHKSVSPFEILTWILSFFRKHIYRIPDYKTQKKILKQHHKNYFFVPLQVYNDAQVFHHSAFHDIIDFIDTVMMSFAHHAPAHSILLIKHHPLDRGHRNYKNFIKIRKKQLGIKKRVFYMHEASLPTLLKSAKGVITINSTVGLSALYHNTPVKALGKTPYNIGGLTYQGSLDKFWQNPGKVNTKNYLKYKNYIINKNQIIGSFYKKIF